jgi:hypothetical protein
VYEGSGTSAAEKVKAHHVDMANDLMTAVETGDAARLE